jgi:hypothetical protein
MIDVKINFSSVYSECELECVCFNAVRSSEQRRDAVPVKPKSRNCLRLEFFIMILIMIPVPVICIEI